MKEYIPGMGWVDDGYIYSAQQFSVEAERERRRLSCYQESGNVHGSKAEIVVVHETFLRDLKTTPVLSTVKGKHPADQGLLEDYKVRMAKAGTLGFDPVAQLARNTSALSAAL